MTERHDCTISQSARQDRSDRRKLNLLREHISNKDSPSKPAGDTDNGASSVAQVECVFRNIEDRICYEIAKHTVVVGCVAWLTSPTILAVLARMTDVAIILQKEDFLRPDRGGPDKAELRAAYRRLPQPMNENTTIDSYHFGYNICCGFDTEAVRCVGYHVDKDRTLPRMHNKFLVLGGPDKHGLFEPRTVISGSYNMTANATRSFENIVIVKSLDLADAYFNEFITIYGLSEPLDWRHEYVDPHYNSGDGDLNISIGT